MSQNYETAQANPEIHLLPGNLKDARDAIFPYFGGRMVGPVRCIWKMYVDRPTSLRWSVLSRAY
jgi:hypothetical protein